MSFLTIARWWGSRHQKFQRTTRLGKQCRKNTNLNFSPRYIANLMPTLSYCKSVNNCSPNLLLFKVARNEKLYFGPFFLALRFGPALHSCLFVLHNAHHAQSCFLPTPCSAFALSAFDLSPCPAMSSPALSSPALLANSLISGRSDRKVLRLIYIFRDRRFCSQLCLLFNCLSFP